MRPDEGSKSIVLSFETENVITFVYSEKSETTGYTVHYYIEGTTIPVADSRTVTGISGNTLSVIETAKAIDYDALYAAHPELAGKEYFPDASQKTLTLGAVESNNILIFYYSEYRNATVTVRFVDMAGNEIASTDTQSYKVGKTFTLSRTPIAGWELSKAVVGTGYNGTAAGDSYKITQDICHTGLEFTLFYRKKLTITAVSRSKQYDGTALTIAPDLNNQITYEGLLTGDSISSVSYTYTNADNDEGNGRVNVGTAVVTPGSAVISGAHENTRNYYTIRYISGTLNVTKIYVTVRIEPDRWTGNVYDGNVRKTGFTNNSKSVADYILISFDVYKEAYLDDIWDAVKSYATHDETAAGLGYVLLSEKDAGDYSYTLPLTLADLPQNDNYGVSLYVRPGRLQILPKSVSITTGSDTKTYDGTPLTKNEYSVTGIVEGETYGFAVTGSQTEVGTSSNTYSITWAADDNEYTAREGNYTVS